MEEKTKKLSRSRVPETGVVPGAVLATLEAGKRVVER